MKKSLFLLPLLAGLALCGCDKNKGGNGEGGLEEEIVIDYESVTAETGGKTGYKAAAKISQVCGIEAEFTDCGPMDYYHDSIPAWDPATKDESAKVLQFKASTGEFTLFDIQPKKVTVVVLTSYDYTKNDNIGVEFNDEKVSEKKGGIEETDWKQYGTKKEGEETVTDYEKTYEIKRLTLTYNVSAEESGDLRIFNCGAKGLRAVESVTIE